jgi:transcription elongation factor GreA
MNPRSAIASTYSAPSPSQRWPMTRAAREELLELLPRLAAEASAVPNNTIDSDGSSPDPQVTLISAAQAARRYEKVRAVLDGAHVVPDPTHAVIGSHVTIHEGTGDRATYVLVAPGANGNGIDAVSADCPLGAAILGRRAGETVTFAAPTGERSVTIEAVEEVVT